MATRTLGKSGLQIGPLALGCNVFGWTIDEPTSHAILDAFVSGGLNFLDTANIYSTWKPGNKGGESEAIIGNWLAKPGNRERVVLATKVGMEMGDGGKGLRKDYILREAEASLKRLRTDHIDLYQSHQDDAETPIEETLEAYAQLIKTGKVRAIGASNYDATRLAASLRIADRAGLPRYASLQPE